MPVFKDPFLVLQHAGMGLPTNFAGWVYADGTTVPTSAWVGGEPNNPAPGEPAAGIITTDGLLVDTPYTLLYNNPDPTVTTVAFYECCGFTQNTCTGLTEVTEAPTRAPTKGKSRRLH